MADLVNQVIDTAFKLGPEIKDAGKVVAKIVSSTSVNRLAKDSVFQFPVLISSSIDTDEIHDIGKCLEKNYASVMASVLSLRSYVDLSKYKSLVGYLRTFHSNGEKGGKLDITAEQESDVRLESASIVTEGIIKGDTGLLWDILTEDLDTACLNDMYLPYKRTRQKLLRALEAAEKTLNPHLVGEQDPVTGKIEYKDRTGAGINGGTTINKKGEVVTVNPKFMNAAAVKMKDNDRANTVVKDDTFANMTPTLVNLQFVVDATGKGNVWKQSVVIGVKAMVRTVKSSLMVSNLIEATTDRPIFRFIQWTKGEINLAQLLSGFDKIKDEEIAAVKKSSWIHTLRRRAKKAKSGRMFGKQLLPNTTIVITEQERLAVQDATKLDLMNASVINKLMEKYFLLNFAVYDTEAKIIHIIQDGETSFSTYSLRSLVAQNMKDNQQLALANY